jgi:hypothetical protein
MTGVRRLLQEAAADADLAGGLDNIPVGDRGITPGFI